MIKHIEMGLDARGVPVAATKNIWVSVSGDLEYSKSAVQEVFYNLNLKGCQLKEALAFLDLAQNSIRDLGRGSLAGLATFTALNLERNVIQALEADTFYGVNNTLSFFSQTTLEENNYYTYIFD